MGSDFDHLDPAVMAAPASSYRELRESEPVSRSERYGGFVVVAGYEHVRAAARDWQTYSSRAISIPGEAGSSIPIMVDPPEHGRYRAALDRSLSREQARVMTPQIARRVGELIDAFVGLGECEVSAELTQPLATWVLARVLGVPEADDDRFAAWMEPLVFDAAPSMLEGKLATARLHQFLTALVGGREPRAPGLVADLKGVLRDDEIVNIGMTMTFAALGPTTFAMNGALELLDRDRGLRRRLADEPSLVGAAVEEFLRLVSPVQSIGRVATRDAVCAGERIAPGERVLLLWGSANRDDSVFAAPDQVDLGRGPNRHLAFGAGAHQCPGAHLARVQLRAVLDAVLARLPDYRVSDRAAIGWQRGHTTGINRLPITFTPGPRAEASGSARS